MPRRGAWRLVGDAAFTETLWARRGVAEDELGFGRMGRAWEVPWEILRRSGARVGGQVLGEVDLPADRQRRLLSAELPEQQYRSRRKIKRDV